MTTMQGADVIIGRHHGQPGGVSQTTAVSRRVNAAEAEARHRRRQVEVGRDGTQSSRVARVRNVQVITARQTRLNHCLQTVHEQLRVVLVLSRLAQQPHHT